MSAKIILRKDQLFQEMYSGAIKELKVLGFPQEKCPLKPYSNIFYWSRITSDFGCSIPEHSNLGFEILTFVLKGSFEINSQSEDKSIYLKEGDMGLIKAGKGLRHSDNFQPRTEVIQIWFDPDYDQNCKNSPELLYFKADSFPNSANDNDMRRARLLGGKNAPLQLNSKDVSIELHEFSAGYHMLTCPEDSVLSSYVMDGYIEIDDVTLGKGDFFKVDEEHEIKIASLVNSKIFLATTPYKPEYKPYSLMNNLI